MSEAKVYPHHEKCVGGNCPIKSHCLLFQINAGDALWKIRPPFSMNARISLRESLNKRSSLSLHLQQIEAKERKKFNCENFKPV